MDKIARLKLCDKLSPGRFEKTAAPLKQVLSNLGTSIKGGFQNFGKFFNQVLDSTPNFETPDQGFFKSLWNSTVGYLNPKNYKDTLKHGIPLYLKSLRDTTFSPKAWKNDFLGTSLATLGNTLPPYMALRFLTEDDPQHDTEGFVQSLARNTMNVADVLDPTGGIMNRGVKGIVPMMIGGSLGRFGFIPEGFKKIDEVLGTGVSKEKLTKKFLNRVYTELPKFMKENPGVSHQEAESTVVRNILQAYGQDAADKIFS